MTKSIYVIHIIASLILLKHAVNNYKLLVITLIYFVISLLSYFTIKYTSSKF